MNKLEFVVGGKVGSKVSISVQFVNGVIYWLDAEITLVTGKQKYDWWGWCREQACLWLSEEQHPVIPGAWLSDPCGSLPAQDVLIPWLWFSSAAAFWSQGRADKCAPVLMKFALLG